MSTWKEFKLKEFAEIQTGPFGSQLHASDYVDFGTPSIMPTNIGNRLNIVTDKIVFVSNEDVERLKKYTVKESDIVYSRRGDVEKCAYITEEQAGWLCGTGCLRIRFTSKEISPKFCAYYLSTPQIRSWVLNSAVGTTMPNLNTTILGELPLVIPNLEEQILISETLSSIDDKIDLLNRQIKTLESISEILFKEWLKSDEVWEKKTINSLIEIQSGFAFKSDDFLDEGNYKLVTIKNVQDGYLDLSKTDNLNEIPSRMPEHCLLKTGDILLSLTGNVGRCCLVTEENLLLNQRVAKLKPKNDRDIAFTYFMFRQTSMRKTLEELSKGTAQSNLSPIETGQIEINVPPLHLLKKYSDEVNPLFDKVLKNKIQIKTLTKLRDTLLPKLMSGEVIIND